MVAVSAFVFMSMFFFNKVSVEWPLAGQTSENNSNILFSQFRFQKFWRQILPLFDRKSPDLLEVIRYYNQERRRILIMTVHGRLQLQIDNFSFIFNFSVQES